MPYTRKEYAHGTPQPRISMFEMGDRKAEYDSEVVLRASEDGLLSDRSLEAIRTHINRALESSVPKYHYKIKVFPHTIVRGKKWLAFAGADRISSGMRKAFGRPTGRGAQVNRKQEIAIVRVDKGDVDYVKELFQSARPKLAVPCTIEVRESPSSK